MKIGYARVSTLDQQLNLQQDALQQAGCEKIIVDQVSGTVADRPGLTQVKELLRTGDTLVVWYAMTKLIIPAAQQSLMKSVPHISGIAL